MISTRKLRAFAVFMAVALSIPFAVSCGKKGPPTLTTFEKPSTVRDIRVVHREDQLIISWSYPAAGREAVKGFYIEKAEAGEGKPFRNLVFLRSDSSQFVDKDFAAGKKYLYRMRAYSLRNILSDESRVIEAAPVELPPPPAGLSYKVTKDSIEVTWDRVSASALYNIFRSYEKGKTPASPVNKTPLKDPSFKDRVEAEKVVYYTVRSLLDTVIRDEGYPSGELEVTPEAFVPSPPSHLKYVPSEKKTYLMWDENPETWVKGYRVYRKKLSDRGFVLAGETVTPAFADPGPVAAKTYYYITAVGPKEEGAPSETLEIPPLKE